MNNIDKRFRNFMQSFNGMATKYIQEPFELIFEKDEA